MNYDVFCRVMNLTRFNRQANIAYIYQCLCCSEPLQPIHTGFTSRGTDIGIEFLLFIRGALSSALSVSLAIRWQNVLIGPQL